MNEQLLKQIDAFSDVRCIKFFNFFAEELMNGIEEENLQTKIQGDLKQSSEIKKISDMNPKLMSQDLSYTDSAFMARKLLIYFAKDDLLSKVLGKAFDEYKEEEDLFAGAVLAIGLAASMVIFSATTEIKGKILGMDFNKTKADPELVKAILEPFANIVKKII